MDPVTIATKVVSVLMPVVAEGAKEFMVNVGKDVFEKAKKLLDTLRSRFAGDNEASDNLADFERKPKRYGSVLADVLQEKLSEDKDFAEELQQFLSDLGPNLEVILKFGNASGLTVLKADHFKSGKARLEVTGEEIKDSTVTDIGTIG